MSKARRYAGIVRENFTDPSFWLQGPGFLWRHVLTDPLRRVADRSMRRGEVEHFSIAEADWDNCIVLDACRYDTFEACADPEWDLRPRISCGSDTGEFLESNYPPSVSEPDLVYVNANPRVANEPTGEFHAIDHVWKSNWNAEYGTVMPEDACEAAAEAAETYPHKRLLVHLVQPHIPYVGETADELPSGAAIQGMRPGEEMDEPKPYALVKEGVVEPETVERAYRESLELALDAVEPLVDRMAGKTVVTADHGDLMGESDGRRFGEFQQWGHPPNTPVEPLRKVPWAIPPFEDRKDVHEGTVTDTNEVDPDQEQLESLGYL
jgi:hypothetical protein